MINKKILLLLFSLVVCSHLNAKVKLINLSNQTVELKYTFFADLWGDRLTEVIRVEPGVGKTSYLDFSTDQKLSFKLFSNGKLVASKEFPKFGIERFGDKVITVTRNVDTNQFVMDIKPLK